MGSIKSALLCGLRHHFWATHFLVMKVQSFELAELEINLDWIRTELGAKFRSKINRGGKEWNRLKIVL